MDNEKNNFIEAGEECSHLLSAEFSINGFGWGKVIGREYFKFCPSCGVRISELPLIKSMYLNTYEEQHGLLDRNTTLPNDHE